MADNKILMYGVIIFIGSILFGIINVGDIQSAIGIAPREEAIQPTYPVVDEATAKRIPIENLQMSTMTRGANSYTADSTGSFRIYADGVNPSDPNTNPIVTISMSSGVGTDNTTRIMTDTPYRVVYNGVTTYYSRDLGTVVFASRDYSEQTGVFAYPTQEIATIATFATLGDVTATTGNNEPLVCNGQAANTQDLELYGSGTTLTYNQTAGDGTITPCITIEATGTNQFVRDVVIEFRNEATNPPSGNEITSFTVAHREGKDFGIARNLLNYWQSEGIVRVEDEIEGGTYGVYRLTIDFDEAQITASEDGWSMYLDDLGSYNGRDMLLNSGASSVGMTFAFGV